MSDPQTTWNDEEGPKKLGRPVSAAAHEEVFRMWEAGIRDLDEIGLETGYRPSYVKYLLKARGIEVTRANARPQEVLTNIITDYVEGMGIRKLLKRHNISNNTLYEILDENQIPNRRSSGPGLRRVEQLDKAVEMYLAGEPVKVISSATGIVPSILYATLEEREIPMRIRPDFQQPVIDRAVSMYLEGAKIDDIVLETGINSARLYQILQESNIPGRRQPSSQDRLDSAVALYERGADVGTIMSEAQVGSQQLYKELRLRGIALRNGKRAQGANVVLALDLYDKGETFLSIQRQSGITLLEMTNALVQRGTNLRTGLPPRRIKSSMDIAVQEYNDGIPDEDITIDTLVTKVQLLAELRNRGMELRP